MPRIKAAKTANQVRSEISGMRSEPSQRTDSIADRLICTVVDALAQVLARFEVRYMFAGKRHRLPGLRVAALARRAKVQREAAEAADLYPFAGGQCIAHDFQQLLHGEFHVLRRKMLLLGRNDLNEFRFRHYRSGSITRHPLECNAAPAVAAALPSVPQS